MQYYYFDGEELPKDDEVMFYGNLKAIKHESLYKEEEMFLVPEQLSGSDYSGTLINVSNHRVFLDRFGKLDGVFNVWGGHDTYAIAISRMLYESNIDVAYVIDTIENDYFLIDEEDYSTLHTDVIEETWEDWYKIEVFNRLKESHPLLENLKIDYNDLYALFNSCMEETGIDWELVTGKNVYIEIDTLFPYLLNLVLVRSVAQKDLPLLINFDWVSNKAYEEFEAKMKGVCHENNK